MTKHRFALVRGLVLTCHWEPSLAVTIIAVALSTSSGRTWSGVVFVGLAVFCGQLSVGWHNDWLDADRDRQAGRRDKPLARGEISIRSVGWAAAIAGLSTVPLSFLSGWLAGWTHIVAVAFAWAYNAWLKSTVFSFLPYALSFALLVAFIAFGLPSSPMPPWWALAAAALLGVGAHLTNVLPDLDEDIRHGVRGLPQRMGKTATTIGAVFLLVSATFVLAWGPGSPGILQLSCIGLVAALLVFGMLQGRRNQSRAFFRTTLVIALIDVGMFITAGHWSNQ